MNWKGPLAIFLLFVLILVAYTVVTMNQKPNLPPPAKNPFSFSASIYSYSLLDSDEGKESRAATTMTLNSVSANNITLEMLLLPRSPNAAVYDVSDYNIPPEKAAIMKTIRRELDVYGIGIEDVSADRALEKKGAVLLLPASALPERFASDELTSLIDGNTVLIFGKPLNIVVDKTGAQKITNTTVYRMLNVSYSESGVITTKVNGPKVFQSGKATVLEYATGWLIIYDDLIDPEDGAEIAKMIIRQSWQSGKTETIFHPVSVDGSSTITFFSSPAALNSYYIRMLYTAEGDNKSKRYLHDIGLVEKPNGTLLIPEKIRTGQEVPYAFELHENLSYPEMYELRLQFLKNGSTLDSEFAKSIRLQTIASEKGTLSPDLTAGEYEVRLVDQLGAVRAASYTHIPEIKIKLVRIISSNHIFNITIDGKPAASVTGTLTVNNKYNYTLRTGKQGDASVSFMLIPGQHTFVVDIDGEKASTVYTKREDDNMQSVYIVFIVAGLFVAAAVVMQSKRTKKFKIKTFRRPPFHSKALSIPFTTFLEIFHRAQEDRAPNLPLSIADLRIGIQKYATFRGSTVFVTDSNIFHLLDTMTAKGHFLSYSGYYLPADMAESRPIEYWVLKRIILDQLVQHGKELQKPRDADFIINGKYIHVWRKLDPKKLFALCKNADNIIVFPHEKAKTEFEARMRQYDENWMRLSLELQYGRLYFQTIDQLMEGGFNGKD
ncbi:MAG: hypothetical protein V1492_02550 [Candidatus Micrarchaeota archaeon]